MRKLRKLKNTYSDNTMSIPQNDWINETNTDKSIPLVHDINKFGSKIHFKYL